MAARGNLTLLVAAMIALGAVAGSASAQITTGTVSGSVKDVQGAVVPGARVTLVSATRVGRNTTLNLASPSDPVTATNLPFDASGNLIASRSLPRGAGFGVANSYQPPRNIQVQVRFSF
jgi:hypothetical protein